MTEHQLKKFNHDNIPDIIKQLELSATIEESINQFQTDIEVFNALIDCQHYQQAIKFLSLGLPKREAIWWAYISAEQVEADKNCLKTQNLLKKANDWVRNPDEEKRRSIYGLSQSLDLYTPSSWMGMAIYWSGGSIAPEDKPEVHPRPFMFGKAVANAINLATEMHQQPIEQAKLYIKQGLHIAMGGNGKIN